MSKGKVVDPIADKDRDPVYALANLIGMCIEGCDPVTVMRSLVLTTANAMVTMTADTRNTVELLERAQEIGNWLASDRTLRPRSKLAWTTTMSACATSKTASPRSRRSPKRLPASSNSHPKETDHGL